MNQITKIIDLSRTNLEAARIMLKAIGKISYEQCKCVILGSLVPMSPDRRLLLNELALKINHKEIAPNLKDLLKILVARPRSFDFVSSVLAKLKKIDYSDVLTCLGISTELKDVKLIYFCTDFAFKCSSKELGRNIFGLLQAMDNDQRLAEMVRAILKTIPAAYLPDKETLGILLKQTASKKGREIVTLLIKRKTLGDSKFMSEGFNAAFSFPAGELPQVTVHGEKIKIPFSHHLVAHCGINFEDIVQSPAGPAIVVAYKHGSLIIVPIGESEAFYLDGLALKDFRKCGIKKIGQYSR